MRLDNFSNFTGHLKYNKVSSTVISIVDAIRSHLQWIRLSIKADAMLIFDKLWPLLLTWFNFNPSMDK